MDKLRGSTVADPRELLNITMQRVLLQRDVSFFSDTLITERIEFIARYIRNRAPVRFLLACALAKVDKPSLDIRKPYTEIRDADAYSGRTYDEQYLTAFVLENDLPCNPTTAFLTPAFRNRNTVLTVGTSMVGRPETLYKATLQLLEEVQTGLITAQDLLAELVRWLLIIRDEKKQRIETLLASIKTVQGNTALSAETIIKLIEQHMAIPGTSRLPVLIVAGAYETASKQLGQRFLPLERHHAADQQTGSLGDIEITFLSRDDVSTCYEMKTNSLRKTMWIKPYKKF